MIRIETIAPVANVVANARRKPGRYRNPDLAERTWLHSCVAAEPNVEPSVSMMPGFGLRSSGPRLTMLRSLRRPKTADSDTLALPREPTRWRYASISGGFCWSSR
jgi:hypothetical protein